MTTDDKYEGWTNAETWALNLLLSNDEGLYNLTRECVRDALEGRDFETDYGTPAYYAGGSIRNLWEALTDPSETDALAVIDYLQQVGSPWRINWDEIGAAWLEDQS